MVSDCVATMSVGWSRVRSWHGFNKGTMVRGWRNTGGPLEKGVGRQQKRTISRFIRCCNKKEVPRRKRIRIWDYILSLRRFIDGVGETALYIFQLLNMVFLFCLLLFRHLELMLLFWYIYARVNDVVWRCIWWCIWRGCMLTGCIWRCIWRFRWQSDKTVMKSCLQQRCFSGYTFN
jgi:hypothetical protein